MDWSQWEIIIIIFLCVKRLDGSSQLEHFLKLIWIIFAIQTLLLSIVMQNQASASGFPLQMVVVRTSVLGSTAPLATRPSIRRGKFGRLRKSETSIDRQTRISRFLKRDSLLCRGKFHTQKKGSLLSPYLFFFNMLVYSISNKLAFILFQSSSYIFVAKLTFFFGSSWSDI